MSCFDRANGLGHICPMNDQSELTTSWQMIVGGLEIQTDMERLAGRNPLHFVSIFGFCRLIWPSEINLLGVGLAVGLNSRMSVVL